MTKLKMNDNSKYSIDLEVKFGPLEVIDTAKLIEECTQKWQNVSLCTVNNSVIRLAVIEGEFHWHKHDKEDEFFFVLDGQLLIDIKDKIIELQPKQGFMVPRGILHRTRAPTRTSVLVIEDITVKPTGD